MIYANNSRHVPIGFIVDKNPTKIYRVLGTLFIYTSLLLQLHALEKIFKI